MAAFYIFLIITLCLLWLAFKGEEEELTPYERQRREKMERLRQRTKARIEAKQIVFEKPEKDAAEEEQNEGQVKVCGTCRMISVSRWWSRCIKCGFSFRKKRPNQFGDWPPDDMEWWSG